MSSSTHPTKYINTICIIQSQKNTSAKISFFTGHTKRDMVIVLRVFSFRFVLECGRAADGGGCDWCVVIGDDRDV